MKKKILFVATVVKTHIAAFHLSCMKMLKEQGYEVHVAARNDYDNNTKLEIPYCDKYYDIPIRRRPFKLANIRAYSVLKKIIEREDYDIVHCHTPMGGCIARLACRKARKRGTRVFYTAHGFHFYKGAPLKNWLVYYPVERFCARFTDVLITINREDYALAKKMKACRVEYVPGVGIDLDRFEKVDADVMEKRKELGIAQDAIWLLNIGELIRRKNQETVIRAVAGIDNVYLTIVGQGELKEHLQAIIDELNLNNRVFLLGFRKDIAELCCAADVFVFPSFQEGLPVSIMEAMASGLPVVCSRIRGNVDLIDENGGVLFDPHSVDECRLAIMSLIDDRSLCCNMAETNRIRASQFELSNINKCLLEIYDLQ